MEMMLMNVYTDGQRYKNNKKKTLNRLGEDFKG